MNCGLAQVMLCAHQIQLDTIPPYFTSVTLTAAPYPGEQALTVAFEVSVGKKRYGKSFVCDLYSLEEFAANFPPL